MNDLKIFLPSESRSILFIHYAYKLCYYCAIDNGVAEQCEISKDNNLVWFYILFSIFSMYMMVFYNLQFTLQQVVCNW